ncbi:MAG: glycosyltransferase family 2 protein [Nitrospira sp.]|nr:glycosyltransferase family 2 protein [Nitrospira sp.]
MPTPHPPAPSRFAGTLASGRPLVSVIIPTYNRAPLLKTAITSALNQEQAGELFDVEVIVVDDCSPQDMSPIVAAFPGVRYLRLPENRGASGARNAGIKEARGKYVALLDDDDEFLTHKLMIQVPLLEASPDIGVVYGQSVVTGSDTPLLLWPEWAPSGQVFEEFLTRTEDFLHPPTWLVRRELFEAAGWFNEQHRTMEHYDMALRLSMLASWTFLSGGPVARGRFSKKGKWYSNIVNGTNEQRLPRIVESALSRLPATPEAERIRCKARAAVCRSTMVDWRRAGTNQAASPVVAAHLTLAVTRNTGDGVDSADRRHTRRRVSSACAGRESFLGRNQTGHVRFPRRAHHTDARGVGRDALRRGHQHEAGIATAGMDGRARCHRP